MKHAEVLLAGFKLIGLGLLICLERVIGLPLLFVLLGLIWLDQTRDSLSGYVILLLILSYLTAVVFNVMLPISFVVWWLTDSLVIVTAGKLKAKNRRFFIMTIAQNLFWMWWAQLPVGYLTIIQFVLSYLLVIMWMRILKIGVNN